MKRESLFVNGPMRFAACALMIALGIQGAWGKSFSFDLRMNSAEAKSARRLTAATSSAQDGTLRSFNLSSHSSAGTLSCNGREEG